MSAKSAGAEFIVGFDVPWFLGRRLCGRIYGWNMYSVFL
jgi:hypothetical protein